MNSVVARFHNVYMHAKYNCHTTKQMLPIIYTIYIHVPIPTSGMLAHILTGCSRGTGDGQGEEEAKEDTEEGQEVTASERPRSANWHL